MRFEQLRCRRNRIASEYPPPIKTKNPHLPLDEYPALLFFLVFNPPGVLIDRAIGQTGIQGAWAKELGHGTVQKVLGRGMRDFNTPTMDTVRFCQMLAKIAHGFAVAQFGLEGFTPLMPGFILRDFGPKENWPNCYYMVGGEPRDFAPSKALHVLGWSVVEEKSTLYLVVVIRLFANWGAPIFYVVTGEFTPEQRERAGVLEEARARQRDKVPAPGP